MEQAASGSEEPLGDGPGLGGLRSSRAPRGGEPVVRVGVSTWPHRGNRGEILPGAGALGAALPPRGDTWLHLHLLWLQLAVLTCFLGGPQPGSREGEGCVHPGSHPGCGAARLPGLPGGGDRALLCSLPCAGPRAA